MDCLPDHPRWLGVCDLHLSESGALGFFNGPEQDKMLAVRRVNGFFTRSSVVAWYL